MTSLLADRILCIAFTVEGNERRPNLIPVSLPGNVADSPLDPGCSLIRKVRHSSSYDQSSLLFLKIAPSLSMCMESLPSAGWPFGYLSIFSKIGSEFEYVTSKN